MEKDEQKKKNSDTDLRKLITLVELSLAKEYKYFDTYTNTPITSSVDILTHMVLKNPIYMMTPEGEKIDI